MITSSSKVIGVGPDITFTQFYDILNRNNSPVFELALQPAQLYSTILSYGISPAFILAIFNQESNFGKNGYAYANKSPGNTRTCLNKTGAVVNTPDGPYTRYLKWVDGMDDLCLRLTTSNYVYNKEGRVTIEQIIERFAPASENYTKAYIINVVNWMNDWIGSDTMLDVNNIPFSQSPNYETTYNPDEIIIMHLTLSSFLSAKSWLLSVKSGVSATYIVSEDASQAIQLVKDNQTAYHCGNLAYNRKSIGVEVCWGFAGHAGPLPDFLYRAVAKLVAMLCKKHSIPVDRKHIIGHNEVPDPNNPNLFGGEDHHTDPGQYWDWNKFIGMVLEETNGGSTVFDPNPSKFNVGPGVLEVLTKEQMVAVTDEQYFYPKSALLGQRSFTYAQDKAGVSYQIEAIQEVNGDGTPTGPWARQIYKFVKEYK